MLSFFQHCKATALLVLLFTSLPVYSNTEDAELKRITDLVAEHQSCTHDSDCYIAPPYCPFGCNVPLNRETGWRAEIEMKNFKTDCVYDCPGGAKARCVEKRCVIEFLTKPPKPEPVLTEPASSLEQ